MSRERQAAASNGRSGGWNPPVMHAAAGCEKNRPSADVADMTATPSTGGIKLEGHSLLEPGRQKSEDDSVLYALDDDDTLGISAAAAAFNPGSGGGGDGFEGFAERENDGAAAAAPAPTAPLAPPATTAGVETAGAVSPEGVAANRSTEARVRCAFPQAVGISPPIQPAQGTDQLLSAGVLDVTAGGIFGSATVGISPPVRAGAAAAVRVQPSAAVANSSLMAVGITDTRRSAQVDGPPQPPTGAAGLTELPRPEGSSMHVLRVQSPLPTGSASVGEGGRRKCPRLKGRSNNNYSNNNNNYNYNYNNYNSTYTNKGNNGDVAHVGSSNNNSDVTHGGSSNGSSVSSNSSGARSNNTNPEANKGRSSRARLRSYNNPLPGYTSGAAALVPKTEEKEKDASRVAGLRGQACEHKESDGNRCSRRRSFGFPGDKRASRCASHKLDGQKDITSRRCDSDGCSKSPSFGLPGDKTKSRFCAAHKPPGFVDYHKFSRSCKYAPAGGPACNRNPSFGFKGARRTSCAKHKQKGMINLNSPRCLSPDCNLTPNFGVRGTTATCCSKHKKPNMVNVISKRCENETCDRIPSYNHDAVGAKAIYCKTHKAKGMINVRHPRCAQSECKRQPCFGKAGQKIALFCVEHKEPEMVDVKNFYLCNGKRKRRSQTTET